jgi:hypothetical protein
VDAGAGGRGRSGIARAACWSVAVVPAGAASPAQHDAGPCDGERVFL